MSQPCQTSPDNPLTGRRAVPSRLLEAGFTFAHADLDEALADLTRPCDARRNLPNSVEDHFVGHDVLLQSKHLRVKVVRRPKQGYEFPDGGNLPIWTQSGPGHASTRKKFIKLKLLSQKYLPYLLSLDT